MISGKLIATWDVKTKQQRNVVHKAGTEFRDMAYSPDGRMLVVSEYTKVWHIDVQTGERTYLYRHGDEKDRVPTDVRCVRYSRDGKQIVSGDVRGVVKVWDVEKKAEAAQVHCKVAEQSETAVLDLALIPGTDNILVSVEEATRKPDVTTLALKVLLADLKTRQVKTVIDDAPVWYDQGLAVTRDGKLVATQAGDGVRVVSTATWKAEEPAPPKCPLDPAICLFSDSGRLLFAGGNTKGVHSLLGPPGEVAILDRVSNKWVGHFRVLDREVTSMALSPKNDLLAATSGKLGTITVWDLSPITQNLPKGVKENSPDNKRP